MVTTMDIVMFVVPLMVAVVFSLITLAPKGKEKDSNIFTNTMVTFMSALLAAISWFIFGLTWPAVATDVMFVSVACLWYAVGLIFVAFTIAVGVRMLHTAMEVKQPRLVLQQGDDEED